MLTLAVISATLQVLSRVQSGLERLGRGATLEALQPGLSPTQTRQFLQAAGLPADAQTEAIYSWRDGTRTSGLRLDGLQIFPGFYFLSIEDAIHNYRAFDSDPRWRPSWLPLFANGGGDFYLVDFGDPSRPMRHFRIEETEHPIEFGSLSDMMMTLAGGFERSVFFVDGQGFEMDDLKFATLAAELNPRVTWWTDPTLGGLD